MGFWTKVEENLGFSENVGLWFKHKGVYGTKVLKNWDGEILRTPASSFSSDVPPVVAHQFTIIRAGFDPGVSFHPSEFFVDPYGP